MDFTSPVTGMPVTGLTSPTYTLTSDTPLESNQKAWYVSALGGTQTGVSVHSVDKPFQVYISRPKTIKLADGTSTTAVFMLTNVAKNVYKLGVREYTSLNNGGGGGVAEAVVEFRIPIGSPEYDAVRLKALLSLFGGLVSQDPDDLIAWWTSGTL